MIFDKVFVNLCVIYFSDVMRDSKSILHHQPINMDNGHITSPKSDFGTETGDSLQQSSSNSAEIVIGGAVQINTKRSDINISLVI